MVSLMNLDGTGQRMSGVEYSDSVLALHILACIQVHDELVESGPKVSLAKIASCDDILRTVKSEVVRGYFLAFGRHAAPMLRKLLNTKCNIPEQEIDIKVSTLATKLKSVVGTPR